MNGGSVRAGIGQISFKKNLKLKLGGDAVGQEEEKPQSSEMGSTVQPIEEEADDQVELRQPPGAGQGQKNGQQAQPGESQAAKARPRPQLQLGAKQPVSTL